MLAAPRQSARLIGLEGYPRIVRYFGVRDLVLGAGVHDGEGDQNDAQAGASGRFGHWNRLLCHVRTPRRRGWNGSPGNAEVLVPYSRHFGRSVRSGRLG